MSPQWAAVTFSSFQRHRTIHREDGQTSARPKCFWAGNLWWVSDWSLQLTVDYWGHFTHLVTIHPHLRPYVLQSVRAYILPSIYTSIHICFHRSKHILTYIHPFFRTNVHVHTLNLLNFSESPSWNCDVWQW